MILMDRVFIGLLITLAFVVLVIERCKRNLPIHLQSVKAGERLLSRCNVPANRSNYAEVIDAAFLSPDDAATAGNGIFICRVGRIDYEYPV